MKSEEKQRAIKLRRQGWSINQIYPEVGASKSTVSLWVRNIVLTPLQKQELSQKGLRKEIVEKRRETRLRNEAARRQVVIDKAEKEISKLSSKELRLIGTMLYWAEGGKTRKNLVRFSNSDPKMVKIMMAFFRKTCSVPEEKFRGYIHIHPHLDHKNAERYWSSVAEIPLEKFYKTYRKMNKASKHKRDSLPFGTCDIYVLSTELFLKIYGWAYGIFKSY